MLPYLIVAGATFLGARRLGREARFGSFNVRKVRAGDGMHYQIHAAHARTPGERRRAAELLAEINARVLRTIAHLRKHHPRHPVTRLVRRRYFSENLQENSPKDPSGDTAYSLGKGQTVAICIREKDPGASGDPQRHDFHDDLNTLVFVALHELTHVGVEVRQHPPEFWEAFKFVLEEAVDAGVYRPVNYERRPVMYCGMKVDYNPLFDPTLRAAR